MIPRANDKSATGEHGELPLARLLLGGLACAALVTLLTFACGEDQVISTTRNLDRPGPLAFVCTESSDTGVVVVDPDRCAPRDDGSEPPGTLYGFVANTGRGDVALFRTDNDGRLIDLEPGSPGFGFVPVGSFPSDIGATSDGCHLVTANAGSCDLSLIDVPAAIGIVEGQAQPSGRIVSRVTPHTAEGPLGARPQEIALVAGPNGAPSGCGELTSQRAYVTFPSCNLVAEIDLTTGRVIRGALLTEEGTEFTDTPRCLAQCDARDYPQPSSDAAAPPVDAAAPPVDAAAPPVDAAAPPVDAAAPPVDAAAPPVDAGADGAGPADGGGAPADLGHDGDAAAASDTAPGDGDLRPSVTSGRGVLPHGIAAKETGERIYVSSAGANFITVVDIDPTSGQWLRSRRVVLEGDRAQTTRIRLSPPSPVGRFVYAIARDRTVRVVATEMEGTRPEQECETNVDLALVGDDGIALPRAACLPVGDPATPPRAISRTGPGISFRGRLPVDVAFAQPSADPSDAGVEEAGPPVLPLRGTFAFVPVADGTTFVVNVEDQNFVVTGEEVLPGIRLPHRLRNALDGQEESFPAALLDGISGAGAGGVPVLIDERAGQLLPNDGISLRAPGTTTGGQTTLTYEGRLLERSTGQLLLSADATELVLEDLGVDFCAAGIKGRRLVEGRAIEHGDILELIGCRDHDDCGVQQRCRKPVARRSEFGLCLDESREDVLFRECSIYLQRPRELLVRRVEPQRLVLDVLPTEPQTIVERVPAGCQDNADCSAGLLCALEQRRIPDRPELDLDPGDCFRVGCNTDADCPEGSCLRPLEGGPAVCAPIPGPLETQGSCSSDNDCRPQTVGQVCESDRDCDAHAECRRTSSADPDLRCIDRGRRCSRIPGLVGVCARPSPCFAELLHYATRVGRGFLVPGPHRQVADAATGQCIDDLGQSALRVNRLPLGLPIYPVVLGPTCQQVGSGLIQPDPNPCFERTAPGTAGAYGGPTSSTFNEQELGPATIVHFSNATLAFAIGVSHLADPPDASGEGADGGASPLLLPQMPTRGLELQLSINSGYTELAVPQLSSAVALPGAIVDGFDNYVYIVDQGDRPGTTGTSGQVLRFSRSGLGISSFVIR